MTPPTDDRTARERAVEEARHNCEAVNAEADPISARDYLDALILAARLAERARVRETVEPPKGRVTWGITDALAAIDALEAK